VRVSADAVAGEVRVSQEAALAVERRAVAVETLREREHDVRELVDLVPDLAVGDLPEGQRDHVLPDLEGFSDGFVCALLPDLRGVVLYADRKDGETGIQGRLERSKSTSKAAFKIKAT